MPYPHSLAEVPRGYNNEPARWQDPLTGKWIPAYGTSFPVSLGMNRDNLSALNDLRNAVADQLAAVISSAAQLPMESVVVRSVRPFTDLALASGPSGTTDTWQPGVASTNSGNAFSAWLAAKTLSNQPANALGVYGVMDLTPNPNVERMQILKGADTVAVLDFAEMVGDLSEGPIAITRPTLIWRPGEQITINVQNMVAGAKTDALVLLSLFGEPRSQVCAPPIAPRPSGLPTQFGGADTDGLWRLHAA